MCSARGITVLMVAALVWGAARGDAGQQTEEARATALLTEVREALGGTERLAAIKRLQITATTRRANGNFNLEGESEIFLELPGRFRRNESLTIGAGGPAIERKEILNGADFSTEVSGDFAGRGRGRFGGGVPGGGGAPQGDGRGTVSPADQERLREFQRRNLQSEVSRLLLALLLTSETPLRWIGTAQAPDGTADVLEMKTADGAATRIFIDTDTRMPLMLSWTGPAGRGFGGRAGQGRRGQGAGEPSADESGAGPGAAERGEAQPQGRRGRGAQASPMTLEMHLADYQTVNGVKLPHLITRGASGTTNEEWVVKRYRVNPDFRANTFTQ